ncbi:sialin-like [Lineus longissimus]|uniref:sialin-like n=1 Tax=Lineus longissimus TaxID=88925 RepID=UPI002B4EB163
MAQEQTTELAQKGFGWRHVLVLMAFFGTVNLYTIRFGISVALVAMVNQTAVLVPSGINGSEECPQNIQNQTNSTAKDGEFVWDAETQGIINGAFSYGYIVTQIPGGWLADKIGGKHVMGTGIFGMGILTILIPVAARLSLYAFIALRVVQGLVGGVMYPSLFSLLGKWLPPIENTRYTGIIQSGMFMGTVISMALSGVLCESLGWPSVFYIFGSLTFIWYALWLFLVYSEPSCHPRISSQEKNYIMASLQITSGTKKVERRTPWKAILTSAPVWGIVIGMTLPALQYFTLLTSLPQYMKEILRFDINQNGLLSAVPYLALWIITIFTGYSADLLRERRIMSITAVRKLYTTLSVLIPGAFLVSVGFVGCDQTLAVVLLTLSVGTSGFTYGGKDNNALDIAPYFAGSVMGIINCASNLPAVVAPYLVGYITDEKQSIHQWQLVFYINAAVGVGGWLAFMALGSGERQEWDREVISVEERTYLIQDSDEDDRDHRRKDSYGPVRNERI